MAVFVWPWRSLRRLLADIRGNRSDLGLRGFNSVLFGLLFYSSVSVWQWQSAKHFVSQTDAVFGVAAMAVVVAVIMLVTYRALLKTTPAAQDFKIAWAVMMGAMCVPIAYGLLVDLNGKLDSRNSLSVNRVVKSKYENKDAGFLGDRYQVCLEPAVLASSAPVDVDECRFVSSREFDDLRVGDAIQVKVGQGALGLQWFKEFRRLER